MSCAVVGGGIIGLAIAWRLARRGVDVTVHDAGTDGAWQVAAGMLAPGGESAFEAPALGRLLAESARRWPGFAAELGGDVGYDDAGTLSVALTADDVAEASRAWGGRAAPTALREPEPALSPRVRPACTPRTITRSTPGWWSRPWRRAARAGRVNRLDEVDADTVVVAAGCGTAALTGLPVRPVKGQVLRLRGEPGLIRHVISGYADGRQVYLVPRADGEIVVGATQEERTDHAVTAGGVLDLLRAAIDLVPELAEFELVETIAGHRPGTPDNAPLLGRLDDRTSWRPGTTATGCCSRRSPPT